MRVEDGRLEVTLAEALKEARTKEEHARIKKQVKQEFAWRRPKLHSLRHSFATWEIALNGADPKTLTIKLGHAKTSFTPDVYA